MIIAFIFDQPWNCSIHRQKDRQMDRQTEWHTKQHYPSGPQDRWEIQIDDHPPPPPPPLDECVWIKKFTEQWTQRLNVATTIIMVGPNRVRTQITYHGEATPYWAYCPRWTHVTTEITRTTFRFDMPVVSRMRLALMRIDAILYVWHHFQPPSWICSHVTSHIQDGCNPHNGQTGKPNISCPIVFNFKKVFKKQSLQVQLRPRQNGRHFLK